jgi:hypothetical protein
MHAGFDGSRIGEGIERQVIGRAAGILDGSVAEKPVERRLDLPHIERRFTQRTEFV